MLYYFNRDVPLSAIDELGHRLAYNMLRVGLGGSKGSAPFTALVGRTPTTHTHPCRSIVQHAARAKTQTNDPQLRSRTVPKSSAVLSKERAHAFPFPLRTFALTASAQSQDPTPAHKTPDTGPPTPQTQEPGHTEVQTELQIKYPSPHPFFPSCAQHALPLVSRFVPAPPAAHPDLAASNMTAIVAVPYNISRCRCALTCTCQKSNLTCGAAS